MGSVAGDTAPRVFIMKGKGKRNGYTDAYLGIKAPRQVKSQMPKRRRALDPIKTPSPRDPSIFMTLSDS
jgi:hypothetical protein